MQLDLTWLTDHLAMGGAFPAGAAERLAGELGIRLAIDLRGECCDDRAELAGHGIALLHLPTEDVRACTSHDLDTGVDHATRTIAAGGKVLIHCQWGIGRSALLSLCTLVALGWEPLAALLHAKDRRPLVSPSPEQLRAFLAFVERRGAAPVPSLDELATVAYRHLASTAGEEEKASSSTRRW